jgi:hypothetical protein
MIIRFFQKLKWLLIRHRYLWAQSSERYWGNEYRELPESSREKIEVSITPYVKGNLLIGYVFNNLRDGKKIIFCIKSKDCNTKTFELKNINLIKKYDAFQVKEFYRG